MKIAYLSGPANVPQIYGEWLNKTQGYFGTDYMKQFMQLATDLDADCYIVTWRNSDVTEVKLGRFTIYNRPLYEVGGILYYIGQLWWHAKVGLKIAWFRPDLLVLTGNHPFWWTLAYTSLQGTKFLPTLHGTLWPMLKPIQRRSKVFQFLNRVLVFRQCKAIVVTSHHIGRQVRAVTSAGELIYHLPSYQPEQFANIDSPVWGELPFRVICVCRVEANKGIFDVLEIARRLERDYPGQYVFDICGDGSALETAEAEAPPNVTFHGFCDQARLGPILGASNVAIVPSRTEFDAGFEMTCAEAILAGRPLITSAACPALEYLRPASVEVEPDNADAYLQAIVTLSQNRDLYEEKRAACEPLKAQFFDQKNSWHTAMHKAIAKVLS